MPRLPEDVAPVFERYVQGPTAVRAALDGIDAAALNRRPPGEDWSIRDVVIHLADVELVYAVRFRMVIAEAAEPLPSLDPDLWKRRLHYVFRDAEAALGLFQQVRYANAELLRQCDAAAWSRTGHHPTRGPFTLAQVLTLAAEHAEEHSAQITAMRAAVA